MNRRRLLRRASRLLDPQLTLAVLDALIVEVGLMISTVPRLVRLLDIRLDHDGRAEERPQSAPDDVSARWISRRFGAVDRVFRRWPFGDTCLRRALVLGHRLRRLDPVLVIGVRHDEAGRLTAHAWIVAAGVPLDPQSDQYTPLRAIAQR